MTGPDGALRPPKVQRPASRASRPEPLDQPIRGDAGAGAGESQAAKIQAFWAHAAAEGTPLIEPAGDDGQQIVTFVWRAPDDRLPARSTWSVNRLTDERDLERSLMSHVSGTDIWHLSYQLDADWRASYCFCPVSA